MGFLIGVEIDNSRIVWIYNSEQLSAQPVQLTTVSENQQKADIKFYIKTSKGKHFLCSESITNLPPMKAGDPSIDIKHRVSDKTFYYDISLNGSPVRRNSHDLRQYIKSRAPLVISGSIIAAAALILLFIFLLMPMITNKAQPAPSPEAQPDIKPAVDTAASEPVETPDMPAEDVKEQQTAEQLPVPEISETVFIESEITDSHAVYFEPESDILTSEAVKGLKIFIDKLPKESEFEEAQFELEIRGHCARYGTEEGRAELSEDRALRVYRFLESGWGIEADSFVTGAGADEPVSLKRDEQHLNRRVDINIKGNIRKIEKPD